MHIKSIKIHKIKKIYNIVFCAVTSVTVVTPPRKSLYIGKKRVTDYIFSAVTVTARKEKQWKKQQWKKSHALYMLLYEMLINRKQPLRKEDTILLELLCAKSDEKVMTNFSSQRDYKGTANFSFFRKRSGNKVEEKNGIKMDTIFWVFSRTQRL